MKEQKAAQREGGLYLLPPAADKCPECATAHAPEAPHNAQSLFYQMKFLMEHRRDPTWVDAMAHCTPEVRAQWTAELEAYGIDVASGQVNPPPAVGPDAPAAPED